MSVLSLAEARIALNTAPDADDAKIQTTVDAAEAALAVRIGPLTSTAVTARVAGGGTMLSPPTTPIVSITSVTPVGGTALTVGNLTISPDKKQIMYTGGGAFGSRWYDVVYQAGRTTVTSDVLEMVKRQADHMWRTQRDPTVIPPMIGGGDGTVMVQRAGDMFSPAVEQLIINGNYDQRQWL